MSTLLTDLKSELTALQTAYTAMISGNAQEYSIAGRSVKRFDLKSIKAEIETLRSRIARLEDGAGRTVARFVPSTGSRA